MTSNRESSSCTAEEINRDIVNECVRFIVCREGCKIPIKRAEIIKHITTSNQISVSQINKVIIEANKVLKNVSKFVVIFQTIVIVFVFSRI